MSKKKEPSRNLIAILSIIAAIVWMIVLILWLLRDSSNFTNDLGIWVGSIGTLVAIYFVVRNTNKQIDNQNKQMHRPHIDICFSEDDTKTEDDKGTTKFSYKLCSQSYIENRRNNEKAKKPCKYSLNIKATNVSSNLALNIWLYDCLNKSRMYATNTEVSWATEKKPIEKDQFSPIKILPSKSLERQIQVLYSEEIDEPFDYSVLMFFYSDIYGNTYKTLISVRFEVEEKQLYRPKYMEYFEGSKAFVHVLKDLNIEVNELDKEYYKKLLETKIQRIKR